MISIFKKSTYLFLSLIFSTHSALAGKGNANADQPKTWEYASGDLVLKWDPDKDRAVLYIG